MSGSADPDHTSHSVASDLVLQVCSGLFEGTHGINKVTCVNHLGYINCMVFSVTMNALVAKWVALSLDHKVQGLIPTGGGIQLMTSLHRTFHYRPPIITI